jgi:serine/threonine-protein kinase HipA
LNQSLNVWLNNELVGKLEQKNARMSFRYTTSWLEKPLAKPISLSLPLQADEFDYERCHSFFSGLLPEGLKRQLIAKKLHISPSNDFSFLDAIGGECAGAISFTRSNDLNLENLDLNQIKWLTENELASILTELPTKPLLAGEDGLRLSLAGAQDKLPIVFDGEKIGLPLTNTPSSHILKPQIMNIEESVLNEHFCMKLASLCGLKVAPTVIKKVGNQSFLLVERYDRIPNEKDKWERIHQEDFCQALGIAPELKYQNEGGPSISQCFELIRSLNKAQTQNILGFFDYVIFNALIGNNDAHGKNFSLIFRKNHIELAPLYDALCTTIYPKLSSKMAMKIGGKYKFTEIYSRHWIRFIEEAGLSSASSKKRILEQVKKMPEIAKNLMVTDKLFQRSLIIKEIVTVIDQRCNLIFERLQEH